MAILFDSQNQAPSESIDAFACLFESREVAYDVTVEPPSNRFHQRLWFWQMAQGVGLMQSAGAGYRMVRSAKHLRVAAPERFAIALQLRGTAKHVRDGDQAYVNTNGMYLVDETGPQDYGWSGSGATKAVVIDYSQIGLSPDDIRHGIGRLADSPVSGLVRNHLAGLDVHGDRIQSLDAQRLLATGTISLVRALILTARVDDPRARGSLHDTLYTRVELHIRRHLGDRSLSVETIAHAHNVSVRHLYNIWAASNPVPIAEAIMQQRLEWALAELDSDQSARLTILAIAHKCGFADATHFTRRFRAAFGLTPGEWRRSR